MRRVAALLEERIVQTSAEIHERLVDEVPEYYESGDPALLDVERHSIGAALREIVDGLSHGRTPPERPSGYAVEEARLAAQVGVDLQVLLRTYRVAQALFLQAIIEQAEASVEDPETRVAVLRLASQYQFDWNDRVMAAVIDVYQHERDALFRDRERQKRELVRDLLKGLPIDTAKLAYNVRGAHVGVVAWGAAAEEAARRLAAEAGGALLSVAGPAGAVFAWVGTDDPRDAHHPLGASSGLPEATRVALGEPAAGLEGFRATHRQALQAYRVAHVRPGAVTRYGKVALEGLVIRDLQAAQDFVAHELGPISADDHRDTVLRATLKAYFQTGQNASSAAHLLGVHERTIAYRLRSVEERLGVAVAARRDELATALRLLDLLQASGGPPAGASVPDAVDLAADAAL